MSPPEPQTLVEIRRAVSDDVDAIAHIYLESAEHHARLDPARYRVPPVDAVLTRCRESLYNGVTLVAECDGEIVGFVEARCERSPDLMHREVMFCHVSEIAVRSDVRSRGIGAQLLRAAEEWGRREGAAFALLEYNAANTRAGAFYQQQMGYTVAAIAAIKPL